MAMENTTDVNRNVENFSSLLKDIGGMERIDGVLYQELEGLGKALSRQEILDLLQAVEIRDSDVITCGYPRSGNHWAYDTVHMVRNQTTSYKSDHFWYALVEYKACSKGVLENEPSPRTLVSHVRPTRLPTQAREKKTKMIYLLRNPKDVMVSFYNMRNSQKSDNGGFRMSWDEYFELYMTDCIPYGSWFQHVLNMETFMTENPDVPVYIHVYEDMRLRPLETLKKLCNFLEVPDNLAGDIAKVTDFDQMRSSATKFVDLEKRLFDTHNGPCLMRKGVVGAWKDTFSVAQSERVDQFVREKMAGSKLAAMVKEYM